MPPVRRSTRSHPELDAQQSSKPYSSASITAPIQLPSLPDLSQYTSLAPPPLPHSAARPKSSHSTTSTSSSASRRDPSHSTKKPEGHIPRPPNAFILYRSWARTQKITEMPPGTKKSEQSVSKIVGTLWEDLPEAHKEVFREQARILKAEHRRRWPDYKYSPRPRKSATSAATNPSTSSPSPAPPTKRTAKRMDERSSLLCAQYAEQLRKDRTEEDEIVSGVRNIDEEMAKTLDKAVNAKLYHTARFSRASSCPPKEFPHFPSLPSSSYAARPSTATATCTTASLSRTFGGHIPSCMRPLPGTRLSPLPRTPSPISSSPTEHSGFPSSTVSDYPSTADAFPSFDMRYDFGVGNLDIHDHHWPSSTPSSTLSTPLESNPILPSPFDHYADLDSQNPFIKESDYFNAPVDEGLWNMNMDEMGLDMDMGLNMDLRGLIHHDDNNNPLMQAV